jgi:polyvinyl alcohol dehydrogenase (cytochrome)
MGDSVKVSEESRRERGSCIASGRRKRTALSIVFLWLSACGLPVHAQSADSSSQPTVVLERFVRHSEAGGAPIVHDFCARCHGKLESAPTIATLRSMSTEKIYEALSTGAMKSVAAAYSDEQKRLVAEYLTGRRVGTAASGDAKDMPNRCPRTMKIGSADSPAWSGWGRDLSNTRFQPRGSAGLSPDSVAKLKLKWAFALPGAMSVYGQPAIVDGKVFVSADSGYVYALDATTGCVYWSFRATAGVRSAVTIGPVQGALASYAAYFGDVRGNVYALDAITGRLIWKISADPNAVARIHGAVKLYKNRLYVPVASLEEAEATASNYQCCTSRGSVLALDAATGRTIWKTFTIPEVPKRRMSTAEASYWGPSGAGVWNSPAIDPKRNSLYFGTANALSGPATSGSDAVFALDLDTGKVLWSKQALANDIWLPGCRAGELPELRAGFYCPDPVGPDQDIAAAVILSELPGGQRLAVVGQKTVGVWAYDPDKSGALLWHQSTLRPNTGPGQGGAILFGGAVDNKNVYFALTSSDPSRGSGGLLALELTSGKRKWFRAVPPQRSQRNHPGISAAVSVIPGVVFSGGLDGMLRAFSTTNGSPLWAFDTTQKVKTVNGVVGTGGSIGSAGPVIAGGMVFVSSGYVGFQNGIPGNLLLAFSP